MKPALAINIAGRTGTVRNLPKPIVQVEHFFPIACLDKNHEMTSRNVPGWQVIYKCIKMRMENLKRFSRPATTRSCMAGKMLASRKVSNRKTFAQAALHSVHRWAGAGRDGSRSGGLPDRKPQVFIITEGME
jgi:hypothetical protein